MMQRAVAREPGRVGGAERCHPAANELGHTEAQRLALGLAVRHEVACVGDCDISVFEEGVTAEGARQHRGRGEVEALGFAQGALLR